VVNAERGIRDRATGKPRAEGVKWPRAGEGIGGIGRVKRKDNVK
jgi:hypothetical protein